MLSSIELNMVRNLSLPLLEYISILERIKIEAEAGTMGFFKKHYPNYDNLDSFIHGATVAIDRLTSPLKAHTSITITDNSDTYHLITRFLTMENEKYFCSFVEDVIQGDSAKANYYLGMQSFADLIGDDAESINEFRVVGVISNILKVNEHFKDVFEDAINSVVYEGMEFQDLGGLFLEVVRYGYHEDVIAALRAVWEGYPDAVNRVYDAKN